MKSASLCLCLSLFVFACGGDDSGEPGASDAAPITADAAGPDARGAMPANTIGGTVTYAGSEIGDVGVALYASLPAAGPPVAFTRLTAPTFPATFELTDIDAGSYQLLVVLDIGGDDPTVPGEEDIQVPSESFTVSDEEGAWLDVTITDL